MKKKKNRATLKQVFIVISSQEVPAEQQVDDSEKQFKLIIPKILEIFNFYKTSIPAAVNILTRLLLIVISRIGIEDRTEAANTVCEAFKTMVNNNILEELGEDKK